MNEFRFLTDKQQKYKYQYITIQKMQVTLH